MRALTLMLLLALSSCSSPTPTPTPPPAPAPSPTPTPPTPSPTPAPAPPAPAPAISHAPPLTVMSFNIRYGTAKDGPDAWNYRRGILFDLLRDQHPDVVGLQEALRYQIDEIRAAVPGYSSIGVGRDDGKTAGEHSAILYRTARLALPPESPAPAPPTRGDFWFSPTPQTPGSKGWGADIPRICTWARFQDIQSRAHFYVFNLHLDHQSQPARAHSVEMLVERISQRPTPDPVVITGDFNATPTSPEMSPLFTPPPRTFIDTFPQAPGTFHDFKGGSAGARIDYVFAPVDAMTISARVDTTNRDGRYPSDHYPIVAVIRLPMPR